MLETLAYSAISFSLVSAFLSVTSLLIHYAKRAENPLLTPVYSAIDSLRLSQADLVDKVEHWQKRDRARRVREQVDDLPAQPTGIPAVPHQAPHDVVRAIARSKGHNV